MGFIVGIPRTCGRFATFKMSSFVLLMPKYYSFAYHDIMHDVIGGDKISFIPQKTAWKKRAWTLNLPLYGTLDQFLVRTNTYPKRVISW